jgi:hypothetical protein
MVAQRKIQRRLPRGGTCAPIVVNPGHLGFGNMHLTNQTKISDFCYDGAGRYFFFRFGPGLLATTRFTSSGLI